MNTENNVGKSKNHRIWDEVVDALGFLLLVVGVLLILLSSPFLLDWIKVFITYHSWQLPEEHILDCILGVPFLIGGILLLIIGRKIIPRKKVRINDLGK